MLPRGEEGGGRRGGAVTWLLLWSHSLLSLALWTHLVPTTVLLLGLFLASGGSPFPPLDAPSVHAFPVIWASP